MAPSDANCSEIGQIHEDALIVFGVIETRGGRRDCRRPATGAMYFPDCYRRLPRQGDSFDVACATFFLSMNAEGGIFRNASCGRSSL